MPLEFSENRGWTNGRGNRVKTIKTEFSMKTAKGGVRFQDDNGIEYLGTDPETGLPLIDAENVEVFGPEKSNPPRLGILSRLFRR